MYQVLLGVRILNLCSVLLFVFLSYRTNRLPIVDHSLVLAILILSLVDALLSRVNVPIAERVPSNRLAAMFYKVSPFSWPEPSKNYRIVCAVLLTVMLVAYIVLMST